MLLDSSGPAFEIQLQAVNKAAEELGQQIVVVKVTSKDELDAAFATIRAAAGAVIVGTSALFANQRRKLVKLVADSALPASFDARDLVELGGLMSYGASVPNAYERGGAYVGRILKGKKRPTCQSRLRTRSSWRSIGLPPRRSGSPCPLLSSSRQGDRIAIVDLGALVHPARQVRSFRTAGGIFFGVA